MVNIQEHETDCIVTLNHEAGICDDQGEVYELNNL